MVVPISQIHYDVVTPSRWEVNKMKAVLKRQGQIEPLQVKKIPETGYFTFHQDIWGAAIVQAAREMGWQSLLIYETTSYIP